jgi:cytokinin dehydrogenase
MNKSRSRKVESASTQFATVPLTRRSFVGLAAATGLMTNGGALNRVGAQTPAGSSPLRDLPSLDGEILYSDADRQATAADYGGHVNRSPIAVVKPGSTNDIVRMVGYANKHGFKLAMRGGGHSQYGQSQVEGGIVVDSSSLNVVRWYGNDAIDAQCGAHWGDAAKASLARNLIPPVMVDAMMLTVGGTLSVGGTGETSYRYGAQVDNVLELDVVTGAGEFVTCSPERDSELFHMTLAGLGQCGIIVRARLRLVPASKFIAPRTLTYEDLDTFLSDQARLTAAETLGLLNGAAIRDQDGQSRFELYAGSFVEAEEDGNRRPAWMDGLRFKSERPAAPMPYWNYLDRRAAGATAALAAVKRGVRNAALVATLPDSSVKGIITRALSTPETNIGIATFEVSAKIPARYTRPLLKAPAGNLGYEIRVQRRTTGPGTPDLRTLLAATNALLSRVQAADGKIYPPYCPILSKQQWAEHYGPETWQRFTTAKKQFDPNSVLTPGAGIFS